MNRIIYLTVLFIAIIAAFFTLIYSNTQISNAVTIILTSILVIITLFYASSTKRIAQATENSVSQSALLSLQREYGSKEMNEVIQALWRFYRDCDGDENKIKKTFREDYESGPNIAVENNRRKVTFFYLHLAFLYKHNMINRELITDLFPERDMEIIDKILIPMNQELQDIIDEKDKRKKSEFVHKKLLLNLKRASQ